MSLFFRRSTTALMDAIAFALPFALPLTLLLFSSASGVCRAPAPAIKPLPTGSANQCNLGVSFGDVIRAISTTGTPGTKFQKCGFTADVLISYAMGIEARKNELCSSMKSSPKLKKYLSTGAQYPTFEIKCSKPESVS